jgi:diguanylate cyclase (GGDEF)-like protein
MKDTASVADLKESAHPQKKISHRDPLTGLPNRILFDGRLQQAIRIYKRRQQPFAVVSLELDGIKNINDRHGRVVGDQVLTALSENMKCALRRGDLLARLCGQEFAAVLLDVSSTQDCLPVITRLLEAATQPVTVDDLVLHASASMGISLYPQVGDADAEGILELATLAALDAKRAGRNLYHFHDATQSSPLPLQEDCVERIRQALCVPEFVLFYQPKVNMASGQVIGAEALVRWLHPERGLLAPSEFLPLIEDHQLTVDLGEWVIETALRQMEDWQVDGLAISISVNIGTHQLLQAGFIERLTAILAEHPSIRPTSLELEIQGGGAQDAQQLAQVVRACREMGLSIALDDFGAGSSSLNDLKRLPANVLKIDPSFIRDILDSIEDLNILEGVLGLAAAFRRQFIAEGVESVEHGLLLLRLGCDLAQGYGIAQPMEAHDLPGWVAAWRPDPSWIEATTEGLDDRLLVYTSVEHKSWIAAIEDYLKGNRDSEPLLNRHQCRLGAFVDAGEQAGHNSDKTFQALAAQHWRIHAMCAGIVKLHTMDKTAEGLARIPDVQVLLDKLLEQMKSFRVKI